MSSSSSTTRILCPSFIRYSYLHAARIPAPYVSSTEVARILIVEPHADIRALLEHVVRRLGHEPVVAEWYRTDLPDVQAAVIEPGDPHGIPFARMLRERGVAFVFASIFPAERESLELEPAAYFVKPFALNELESALETALEREHTAA